MSFEPDFSLLLAVYLALLLFGIGYNLLITEIERRGWMEGYTAIAVVAGTLITLGGLALVSWRFALIGLGAFAASGAPMVVGSWWRHVRSREQFQESLRHE